MLMPPHSGMCIKLCFQAVSILLLSEADYLTRYIGSTPPVAPKNTPFQNFLTAFNTGSVNEQHISLEKRNGDWITAELNGSSLPVDCGAFYGATTLNGSNTICSSPSTYQIAGYSVGATFVWSASPSGIVSITPTGDGSQATISKVANGIVTITVNINSSCGSYVATKQITVGAVICYRNLY